MNDTLTAIGWTPRLEGLFHDIAQEGMVPARVAVQHRRVYDVITGEGVRSASILGKLRYDAVSPGDLPVVGDWVAVTILDGTQAVIHTVLPRLTKFSRRAAGDTTQEQVLAANIDTAFWVSSFNRDFNLRRIERYLVAVREGGARPVIVLNKADLCSDTIAPTAEVEAVAPGVPVVAVSAATGWGLELLAPWLTTGETVAFLGTSGVGKSTLINRLLGNEVQRVADIREDDDRGRHTTTTRQLFTLPGGGVVIDTPGIRELQLWDAAEGVTEAFDDIEEIARACYYLDCTHEHEPNCAVKLAVDEGRLNRSRYANFLKMRRELAHTLNGADEHGRQVEKRRSKMLSRTIKRYHRDFE